MDTANRDRWMSEMAGSGIPRDLWDLRLDGILKGPHGSGFAGIAPTCRSWVDGSARHVLITGQTGRGKTTLATALVCERALRTPGTVRVLSPSDLWMAAGGNWKAKEAVMEMMQAHYLLIDDVGKLADVRELPAIKQLLHLVIDRRLWSRLPTLMTSEMAPVALCNWLGEQSTARRTVEMFTLPSGCNVALTGPDLTLEVRQ